MKKKNFKTPLPLLIFIQCTDRIQKVKLLSHPEGFACQIEGSPTKKISYQIFDFFDDYLNPSYGLENYQKVGGDFLNQTENEMIFANQFSSFTKKNSFFKLLDWVNCTPFTKKVLNFLKSIPFGQTLTYGQIANILGCPQSARAIGGACSRNPFPFFIPCHRVISSVGIGGFSEGLDVKKNLLTFERTFNNLDLNKIN